MIQSRKVTITLYRCQSNLNFLDRFWKNSQSNIMKFHPVRAKLFHANGRTSMTKQIAAIHNFANRPQNHTALQNWSLPGHETV